MQNKALKNTFTNSEEINTHLLLNSISSFLKTIQLQQSLPSLPTFYSSDSKDIQQAILNNLGKQAWKNHIFTKEMFANVWCYRNDKLFYNFL